MSDQEIITQRCDAIDAQLKKLFRLCNKIRSHQLDPTGEKAAERSKNSGFNKPLSVTKEYAAFLGINQKTDKISRSEGTKALSAYIREHELKDPENKSVINLDKKLTALLLPEKGDVITHLNIQKYITKHYIKDVPAEDEPAKKKRPTKKSA